MSGYLIKIQMKKLSILLFLTFTLIGFSQKLKSNIALQSGPMVGYCEMTEAMIWLQTTNLATVKIEYFAIDNPAVIFTSDNYSTTKDVGYTYHIILDKLQQGKKYKYNVFIDNKKIVLPYETRSEERRVGKECSS